MNKLFQNSILSIAVIMLLSSCGSLSISQKRYSRGLNISWFSGKDDKKATNSNTDDKKKTNTVNVTEQNSKLETEIIETDVIAYDAINAETSIETNEIARGIKTELTSKTRHSKSIKKETKKLKTEFKKAVNSLRSPQISSSTDETHDGGALRTIGWVFIILGIVFVLIVSILIGVLFMLLGLVFVLAGK